MSRRHYLDASLLLPAQALELSDACRVEEALVDQSAYIVDKRNHTTACSQTRDGDEMQVSFFLAQPPRVSYFCVSCTNEEPAKFRSDSEPQIVATEGNLALFLVKYGPHRTKDDYYIYRAPDAAQGVRPVLERIVHPNPRLFQHNAIYYFHNNEVGLLRYRTNRPDNTPTLRRHGSRHDFDAYKIVTLRTHDAVRNGIGSRYNLYTYDSEDKTWDRKTAVLRGRKYDFPLESHNTQLVITIGGDVGTMGWVDLERGIVLCDVLGGKEDSSATLRYIPLPGKGLVMPGNILRGTSRRYRTVAVVGDRIEYVEVQINVRPGARPKLLHGTYFSDGWTAIRWSRTVSSNWRMDCKLSSSDITIPADTGSLLPMLPPAKAATTLERLHIGHPTISLFDSDIVYFMAKIDEMEEEAWVIAVNTKTKVLQGVTEFTPRNRYSMELTYIPTTISKYLTPGTKGNMKRPGMLLQGSSNKKLLPDVPSMSIQPTDEGSFGQNLHNAQMEQWDDDMDLMDLE